MRFYCLFLSLLQLSHLEEVLSQSKSCRALCKSYFETKLDMYLCRPALNLLPRPTIYKSCLEGRKLGFEKICQPACIEMVSNNNKDVHKINVIPDSYTACKNHKFKLERLEWCRRGYDITFEETKNMVGDFIMIEEYVNPERLRDNNNDLLVLRDDQAEKVSMYDFASNETKKNDEKPNDFETPIAELNANGDNVAVTTPTNSVNKRRSRKALKGKRISQSQALSSKW